MLETQVYVFGKPEGVTMLEKFDIANKGFIPYCSTRLVAQVSG